MTIQIPDFCVFQGKTFQIQGISRDTLPKPINYGMATTPPYSACWRGYIRIFVCEKRKIFLDTMFVETDTPKPINGIMPVDSSEDLSQIQDEIPELSGGQSIVADFKQERVRSSTDIRGLAIEGFSHVYLGIDLPLLFTGKLVLGRVVVKVPFLVNCTLSLSSGRTAV